ncbi:MAG: hypothetical protein M3Q40_10625 [Pseudomonadota bacterium]|nr:hypothetical protein [Pseudomonadota bacterium]
MPRSSRLLLVVLACTAAPSFAALHAVQGEARDPASGNLLYREHHLVRSAAAGPLERLVVYRCPDGRAFARKRVDYRQSAYAPDFELQDARRGYREGLRRQGGQLLVWSDGAPRPMKPPSGAELVADAGFDEFLRAGWSQLEAGEARPMAFVVPTLGRSVAFDIVPLGSDTIGGQLVSRFRLKVDGMLGLVAPTVEVAYSASDRGLRRFTGLTNQRDDRGRPLRARIDFAHPQRPAPDSSWSNALAVPLTACRLGR